MTDKDALSYRDAGVDIDAGAALVERIKPAVARTRRPEVLAGLGGFGGLFELPLDRYRRPVLVAGTDGVGTKLKLALQRNRLQTIGIDLVAMCVNDVLVSGAEPLFFLDYYASARLDVDAAATVIEGIARGCELAGCALLGGETAEMPGLYRDGDFDLAGFCVGAVERDDLIDGSRIAPGSRLIGLASSGVHSNGYSLLRRVLESTPDADCRLADGRHVGDVALEPTRIYVKSVLALLRSLPVQGLVHITGGGLLENVPRILPSGVQARIDDSAWPWPPIFTWLQQHGRIARTEMLRTFNCGIGMVVIVPPSASDQALTLLARAGETPLLIGEIEDAEGAPPRVVLSAG